MQKIYLYKTEEIIEVENNAAHAIIEAGEGELASHRITKVKEVKKSKNKMQKTYKNKGY